MSLLINQQHTPLWIKHESTAIVNSESCLYPHVIWDFTVFYLCSFAQMTASGYMEHSSVRSKIFHCPYRLPAHPSAPVPVFFVCNIISGRTSNRQTDSWSVQIHTQAKSVNICRLQLVQSLECTLLNGMSSLLICWKKCFSNIICERWGMSSYCLSLEAGNNL